MNKWAVSELTKIRYENENSIEKARSLVDKILSNGIQEGANDYIMAQYVFVAEFYWQIGEVNKGHTYITEAQSYAEFVTDKYLLVSLYTLQGNYTYFEGDISSAANYYFRALDLSGAIESDNELSRLYNNIGYLFLLAEGFDESYDYLKLAEKYARRKTDHWLLAGIYDNLTELCFKVEWYDEARVYIERAKNNIEAYGTPQRRLNHELNKWRQAVYEKDKEACRISYEKVSSLVGELPLNNDYIMAMMAMFDNLVVMGDAQLAVKHLEEDIEKLLAVEDYRNLEKYYDHLIKYYKEIGNDEKYNYYIEQVYQIGVYNSQGAAEKRLKILSELNKSYLSQKNERKVITEKISALEDINVHLSATNNSLKVVNDIGVNILSTTRLEEIYDILSKRVNELFHIDEFGIALIDASMEWLNLSFSRYDNDGPLRNKKVFLNSKTSFTVSSYLENKEIIVNNLSMEFPDLYRELKETDEVFLSLMYVPIIADAKPIGVMTVQHRQPNVFTSTHVEIFKLLSTFASVSLKNAYHNKRLETEIKMREETQKSLEYINDQLDYLAKHDELTGLYNRRTFNQVYKETFKLSAELGHSLTVMILDIDYFKEYNDHFGHLEGDKCIVDVATSLSGAVTRAQDLVCRYGGDEFMVLLPETDRHGADTVAKKIMEAIKALNIAHPYSKISEKITISLGVITRILNKDDDADQILIQADQALYKAKKELGRNAYYIAEI